RVPTSCRSSKRHLHRPTLRETSVSKPCFASVPGVLGEDPGIQWPVISDAPPPFRPAILSRNLIVSDSQSREGGAGPSPRRGKHADRSHTRIARMAIRSSAYIDITRPLHGEMPVWPGDPPFELDWAA